MWKGHRGRAADLAAALEIQPDEALALRREFARLVKARIQHIPAGALMQKIVATVEEAAEGEPAFAFQLAMQAGLAPHNALRFCRACASHFLDLARLEAGTGRRLAFCLAEELKRARRWRSEAERQATDDAVRTIARDHLLATGQPELISDESYLEDLHKRMRLRLPLD